MIELQHDRLMFSFPEVHSLAKFSLEFQRTLRLPDEGTHSLPPGLGRFPLRHVDDFSERVPPTWRAHGGVMLPMYASEAMWIAFFDKDYPVAVKIAAGKINAVSGEPWRTGLHREPQDYVTTDRQPWLDGFNVEKDVVRQFVATPLGGGLTAEEQLTGKGEVGGLQIIAYPMKAAVYEEVVAPKLQQLEDLACYASSPGIYRCGGTEMGLGAGGRMRQQIYEDKFRLSDWDLEHGSRCFVHLANSEAWTEIAGTPPPQRPPTVEDYNKAGLPWFEYYDDGAIDGSSELAGLKSVDEPEAAPAPVGPPVIDLSPSRRVREFE